MDTTIITIIAAIVALIAGVFGGKILFAKNTDKQNAIDAILIEDSSVSQMPLMVERIKKIKTVLAEKKPIILLDSLDESAATAQQIAIADIKFCENLFDEQRRSAFQCVLHHRSIQLGVGPRLWPMECVYK